MDLSLIDEIICVREEDAYAAGRDMVACEGVLVGITAGAALWAATQLAPPAGERGQDHRWRYCRRRRALSIHANVPGGRTGCPIKMRSFVPPPRGGGELPQKRYFVYGDALRLPSRTAVIEIIRDFQKILFPAYYGDRDLLKLPPEQYSALLMGRVYDKLLRQLELVMRRGRRARAAPRRSARR